jgi:lipopolysaccharide biosynthesis glycosyltransferase
VATLELACAADRAYIPHTAAMIHSVAQARGSLDLRVHFLHGPRLAERPRRKLEGMVEGLGAGIRFYEIADARVAGLPVYHEITPVMWYRIWLPELVPDAERMLYLDGDALAVDSLEPLWATSLADHLVGAVTNVFHLDPDARARPAALGLPGLDWYFNSGVLLLNLEAMRREGVTGKLMELARSEDLLYPDQDALNAVMGPRRLRLHPRWNFMNSMLDYPWADEVHARAELEEARHRPGIRHFEGGGINKPWRKDCPFEGRELYFEHRRETPWPRVPGRLRQRLTAMRPV